MGRGAGSIVRGLTRPPGIPAERPLAALTARTGDDFALGLVDAWAAVLDVLTFYQERIANEGYLRTATELRSVRELARLVGYEPRPGVSATAYLAYEVDGTSPVTIALGSKAQSVPAAGQTPQTFETAADLLARDKWSKLEPRKARPQVFEPGQTSAGRRVWFTGLGTLLKPNDPLLLVFDAARGEPFRVKSVTLDNPAQLTRVVLQDFRTVPLTLDLGGSVKAAINRTQAAIRGYRDGGDERTNAVMSARAAVLSPLTSLLEEHASATELNQSKYTKTQKNIPEAVRKVLDRGAVEFSDVFEFYTQWLAEVAKPRTMVRELAELVTRVRAAVERLGVSSDPAEVAWAVKVAGIVDRLEAEVKPIADRVQNRPTEKDQNELIVALQRQLAELRKAESDLGTFPALWSRVTILTRALEGATDQLMLNFVRQDLKRHESVPVLPESNELRGSSRVRFAACRTNSRRRPGCCSTALRGWPSCVRPSATGSAEPRRRS